MKQNLMSIFALLALTACVDQRPQLKNETADSPAITFEVVSRGENDIPDDGQRIDKVFMAKNSNAIDGPATAVEFPGAWEKTYQDHVFKVKVPTDEQVFRNQLAAGSRELIYVGFNSVNFSRVSGGSTDVQIGDFKPHIIKRIPSNNEYYFLPQYTEYEGVLYSKNGVYSYAKDILNVAGYRTNYKKNGNGIPFTDFSYWESQFIWNELIGNESGWTVRRKMVLQTEPELLKKYTHARNIYVGREIFNNSDNADAPRKSGYTYGNFKLQSAFARVIVRLRVNSGWWLHKLQVMQIPQFFRLDNTEGIPLLDMLDFSSEACLAAERETDYIWRDAQNNDYTLYQTGPFFFTGSKFYDTGNWLGDLNGLENNLQFDNDRLIGQLGADRQLSKADKQSAHSLYHVSMMFDLIRNRNLSIRLDRSNNKVVLPKNDGSYQHRTMTQILDVYIPPFKVKNGFKTWIPTLNERNGNDVQLMNRPPSDLTPYMKRGLKTYYFPHINIEVLNTTTNDKKAYTGIPIGTPNEDLKFEGIQKNLWRYFPSNVLAGHTYVVEINVGFGSEVTINTYDTTNYRERNLSISFGDKSGILDIIRTEN